MYVLMMPGKGCLEQKAVGRQCLRNGKPDAMQWTGRCGHTPCVPHHAQDPDDRVINASALNVNWAWSNVAPAWPVNASGHWYSKHIEDGSTTLNFLEGVPGVIPSLTLEDPSGFTLDQDAFPRLTLRCWGCGQWKARGFMVGVGIPMLQMHKTSCRQVADSEGLHCVQHEQDHHTARCGFAGSTVWVSTASERNGCVPPEACSGICLLSAAGWLGLGFADVPEAMVPADVYIGFLDSNHTCF